MLTTRVDLADDALMARLHAIEVAAKAHERPWADLESVSAFTLDHRHVDSGEDHELWVATDGGRPVGVAMLWFPLSDNTDKVYAEVQVAPADRGRGAGGALVEAVLARARDHGRTEVLGESLVPLGADRDHPYLRFARRHGFVVASQDSMRHLPLPVADDVLAGLAAEARPAWVGSYRLHTCVDGVPEHLQQSWCETENQLAADAPAGSVDYEPESLTPAIYQERMRLFRAQGRCRYTTVAVDQDEQVVAYTDLVIGAGTRNTVWQWGTLVRREHRGHRLGLAVKVENLRRLQQDHPERTLVVTGNSDVNAPMLAINEAMGFRLVEACPQLQHRI